MEILVDDDPFCSKCTSEVLEAKQITFHNELTLAFLSVMGHKQRMMTDHPAAVVALTRENCEQLLVS